MARNDTPITVTGNLTADPELRFTPAGVAVASFTVAVQWRRYDRAADSWTDGDASFYPVSAWRELGENVAASLAKGDRVTVAGSIAERRWQNEAGENRSRFEVTADDVAASMTFAQLTVRKITRTRVGEAYGSPAAAATDPAMTTEAEHKRQYGERQ